ncbi:MAG: sugar transferase [Gemmatimonadaceae bacterium]|nr:sugar transferase [Gemmatimonadaceae bacterium]
MSSRAINAEASPTQNRAALRLRFALHERRPRKIRNHTMRVATRFAVLVFGDVLAMVMLREVIHAGVFARLIPSDVYAATAFTGTGQTFALLVAATLTALVFTGCHSRHRALNHPIRVLIAASIASISLIIPFALRGNMALALQTFAFTLTALWVALLAVRQLSERMLRVVFPGQRGAGAAIMIGKPDGFARAIAKAIAAPGGDFRIIGHVVDARRADADSVGVLADLPALVEQHSIEAVVVGTELPAARAKELVEDCVQLGCQVLFPAQALNVPDLRPTLVWHHDQPFFEFGSPVLKMRALILKRMLDVLGSIVLLMIAAPVYIVLAIAIRIDSPGPILFRQERAGLGGRRFRMLKFRTMQQGADDQKADLAHLNRSGDARLFKIADDPRVTRLGRLLRRWSIDELPQVWNVFIGDMSLVGPRPFFESDFDSYEDHHFRRLDAKPGITGLWQVSGRSELVNFEDVIYLDRQYIEQWSFWLDISILFRTVPAVLRRTGAF